MLHTVRVRCCSLFHTVAMVVIFVFLCTLGWVFANLYIFQQMKCVCALGVGGLGVGGNHVYHMSQVLSFCQVAVVVMTVFIWRLGGLCQPVHLPADEGGGAGCRCSSALCWLSVGWSRCHRAAYVHHERRHYLCGEV